jgi:hypothetical protein
MTTPMPFVAGLFKSTSMIHSPCSFWEGAAFDSVYDCKSQSQKQGADEDAMDMDMAMEDSRAEENEDNIGLFMDEDDEDEEVSRLCSAVLVRSLPQVDQTHQQHLFGHQEEPARYFHQVSCVTPTQGVQHGIPDAPPALNNQAVKHDWRRRLIFSQGEDNGGDKESSLYLPEDLDLEVRDSFADMLVCARTDSRAKRTPLRRLPPPLLRPAPVKSTHMAPSRQRQYSHQEEEKMRTTTMRAMDNVVYWRKPAHDASVSPDCTSSTNTTSHLGSSVQLSYGEQHAAHSAVAA